MTQTDSPQTSVPKRRLGGTDVEVTPIGLGAWQFSGGKGGARAMWASMSEEETDAVVAAALEGGIDWIDTAELYGFGRSERSVARALLHAGRKRGEVVIATKWNPLLRTAASLRGTIDDRLRCLEPFGIDLYQVHQPLSFSSVEAEMDAMADLLKAGKIRAVGVSNFSADRMRRAHRALARRGLVLASNQVKYSLLDRRIERNGILDAARELGITIIAYSPLEMGLLSGKFHRDPGLLRKCPVGRRLILGRLMEKSRALVERLEAVAAGRGVSASQVALNWLIHAHGELVVAIAGATRAPHARESAAAMSFRLTSEEMARLAG